MLQALYHMGDSQDILARFDREKVWQDTMGLATRYFRRPP